MSMTVKQTVLPLVVEIVVGVPIRPSLSMFAHRTSGSLLVLSVELKLLLIHRPPANTFIEAQK